MSLIKAFVDAFKKASTPKVPDAREHARNDGLLGPTNQNASGSFTPLRAAPSSPGLAGESAVAGGAALPVASADNEEPQAPPKDPRPTDGEGDDLPTPPKSGDFDPDGLDFGKAAAKGEHIKEATLVAGIKGADSPDAQASGGGIVGGLKFDDSSKAEGVDLSIASSDPEEGGEADPASATTLNPAFVDKLGALGGSQAVGVEPEFSDSAPEPPERRFLTQIEEEGGDSTGEGGPVIRPNPGGGEDDDSEGGTEQLIRLQRTPDGPIQVTGLRDTGDAFNVKIEEVMRTAAETPASPGGVPVPYPNVAESSPATLASALPFKVDDGNKVALDFKVQDGMARAAGEPAGDDGLPARDGDGLVDALARKAGKGQQDYLEVKMQEVLVTGRETGVGGDQSKADLRGDLEMARRPDVKDAHDRFANTGPDTKQAAVVDDDDDLEPSSLLELKPAAAPKMLPGLAGESSDDAHRFADLEADDADDDADDTDL